MSFAMFCYVCLSKYWARSRMQDNTIQKKLYTHRQWTLDSIECNYTDTFVYSDPKYIGAKHIGSCWCMCTCIYDIYIYVLFIIIITYYLLLLYIRTIICIVHMYSHTRKSIRSYIYIYIYIDIHREILYTYRYIYIISLCSLSQVSRKQHIKRCLQTFQRCIGPSCFQAGRLGRWIH